MNHAKMLLVLSSISLIVACSPAGEQASDPSQPLQLVQASEDRSSSTNALLSNAAVSDTGVRLELPQVTYGDECIRLIISTSGIQLPEDPSPDFKPPIPVLEAAFFQGNEELAVQPQGGGGGGGGGPDGLINIGQETVYSLGSPLSSGQPLELTVELEMDPFFGFDSPMRFLVQAEPDDSPNCGFQGSANSE